MIYDKRYIQFNNLVFDGYDMISDFDEDISYKGSSQEYSFTHGSYMPFKNSYLYVSERSASMTITLHTKKIPCEYRQYYVRFAEEELGRPGRLWAVKNNELIWAFAYATNISQINRGRSEVVEYDIEFVIPGGVWNKADKQKTFLVPYDVCTFMECKGYKTLNPCIEYSDCDCCPNTRANEVENCFCCCVDKISKDMALCYHLNELQAFYTCDTPYQIVYDCKSAEEFFGTLGQKLCTKDICDDSIIAGRFYSETDIPTEDVTVILNGHMTNPWITINGNTNVIRGEYNGTLTVTPSGDVYYKHGNCEELLDPSVWVIPAGMDYGWTVKPRSNSVIIHLNECCQGITCAYIQHQPITN